ncbi:MAG: ABC-type amino acid transport substrate-binding protein [Alteromonadaceae bacterium]|jgi:ABC-type amino acid transport substrate-binding protein
MKCLLNMIAFRVLLNVFICSFLIHSPSFAQQKVVVNDVEWPPYFFIGDTKKQLGLGKDLINICLHKMDYKAEYHRLPIKRTLALMEIGEIDITVYSYLASRESILHYSTEFIFSTDYAFMVRADSDIVINKLADLAPYRMGHLAGLTYTPELLKIINEKDKVNEVVTGFSLRSMFSQLLAPTPRFDIIADARDTFYWRANTLGISDKIKVLDYKIKTKKYYITVSKQSKNIKDAVSFLNKTDTCLQKLKKSGEYQAILANYGIQPAS